MMGASIITAPGGRATLITGDAIESLAHVPDDSIDAIITSPPYDGIRDYHGGWELDIPALGREVHRVLRDGGVACVVIGDQTIDGAKTGTTALLTAAWITDTPLRLWEQLVYARHGRPGAWWASRFRVDHESILVFVKGKRRGYLDKSHLREESGQPGKAISGTTRRTDGSTPRVSRGRMVGETKERGTIWRYNTSNTEGNNLKREHPATYPDALADDLIRAFVPAGGVVLDPFVGSGTTVVAALNAGRDAVGIDISADYTELAARRIESECAVLVGASA